MITSAVLLEDRMSQASDPGGVAQLEQAPEATSSMNPFNALQAVIERLDTSFSAVEAREAPPVDHSAGQFDDLPPFEGPILVPGHFGDASASLTSS